jgi:hypothetical protein
MYCDLDLKSLYILLNVQLCALIKHYPEAPKFIELDVFIYPWGDLFSGTYLSNIPKIYVNLVRQITFLLDILQYIAQKIVLPWMKLIMVSTKNS